MFTDMGCWFRGRVVHCVNAFRGENESGFLVKHESDVSGKKSQIYVYLGLLLTNVDMYF